jgi:hypothetical protein
MVEETVTMRTSLAGSAAAAVWRRGRRWVVRTKWPTWLEMVSVPL